MQMRIFIGLCVCDDDGVCVSRLCVFIDKLERLNFTRRLL